MNAQSLTIDQIDVLNERCFCIPTQRDALCSELRKRLEALAGCEAVSPGFTTPFSDAAVFLRRQDYEAMVALITATRIVANMPQYQDTIALRQPDLPWSLQSQTLGLIMGYDFHVTPDGPRLIEINTNAGGTFVAKMLAGRTLGNSNCCPNDALTNELEIDAVLHAMFLKEWALARHDQPLKTIAIVDETPERQYLFPDMLLAMDFLVRRGIDALVCDVRDLSFDGEMVWCGGKKVDMVYNRLTDFMLEDTASASLRAAYEADQVVLSPAPLHHALYADKRNLTVLGDAERLCSWGIDEKHRRAMSMVPETREITFAEGATWWNARKNFFFKPHSGFGSRAAYRGDKVTKKVWGEITSGGFIAQKLIPPATRGVKSEGIQAHLKYDVRVYAFGGQPLFPIARLYSGQTTNFRTKGGGFAEVIVV